MGATRDLFLHYVAYGWPNVLFAVADGLIATGIVLRLLLADIPPGARVIWPVRALRYGLATVYTIIAVRIWSGWYWLPVDPTELLPDLLMLALVLVARGDMRALWRAITDMRADHQKP
jgi:hypothetical protein